MRSRASRTYLAEYFSYAKIFRKNFLSENRPTRKTYIFNEFVRFFLKSKLKVSGRAGIVALCLYLLWREQCM